MNPLDWTGPEFLALYLPLLAAGFIAALLLRHALRTPSGVPRVQGQRMDPYEVAALDGPETFVAAVVAALFQRGVLDVVNGKLVTQAPLPPGGDAVERSVYEAVATGSTSLEDLRRGLAPDLQQAVNRLTRKGLLVDEAQSLQVRLRPLLVFGAVLLLGGLKVLVGLSRDRPVAYLVMVLLISVLGLLVLGRKPWRSRLGDATLKALRQEHQPLRTTAMSQGVMNALSTRDVALAVGLFGPALLVPLGYPQLRTYLQPSNSGGGSGGDGGGDGGSCGGGCGGCGGGD